MATQSQAISNKATDLDRVGGDSVVPAEKLVFRLGRDPRVHLVQGAHRLELLVPSFADHVEEVHDQGRRAVGVVEDLDGQLDGRLG